MAIFDKPQQRTLPQFTISDIYKLCRPETMSVDYWYATEPTPLCWTRKSACRLWVKVGKPRTFDVLTLICLLRPPDILDNELRRIICCMLPVGFAGYGRGRDVRILDLRCFIASLVLWRAGYGPRDTKDVLEGYGWLDPTFFDAF